MLKDLQVLGTRTNSSIKWDCLNKVLIHIEINCCFLNFLISLHLFYQFS